jgi:hypothetical protein
MTFKVARVTVEYNYGWECATCEEAQKKEPDLQYFDSGYSNPEDAGAAAKEHNRREAKRHERLLAAERKARR